MMEQSLEPLNTCSLSGVMTTHVTGRKWPRHTVTSSADGTTYYSIEAPQHWSYNVNLHCCPSFISNDYV